MHSLRKISGLDAFWRESSQLLFVLFMLLQKDAVKKKKKKISYIYFHSFIIFINFHSLCHDFPSFSLIVVSKEKMG